LRTIRVKAAVWNLIQESRKPGEHIDDVLRRLLNIRDKEELQTNSTRVKQNITFEDRYLCIRYEPGISKKWTLPPKTDRARIKRLRNRVVKFAREYGIPETQIKHIERRLNLEGYYWGKDRMCGKIGSRDKDAAVRSVPTFLPRW
jgi:hypothetical protein